LGRRDWIVAALASGTLAGCQRDDRPAKSGMALPLRLAFDLWAGYYPALLAEELGYLREANVAVTVTFPGDTDRMISEFAAGQHDLIGVSISDLINLTRGRIDVRVVMLTDESAGADVIFVRQGVNLRAKGLRVATNLGGFGEMFVREFLERKGLAGTDVAWVNADAAQVPAMLASGVVDVAHTWEPYASQVDVALAQRVFTTAETPGLVPDVLACANALAEREPQALRGLIAAWMRAQQWWANNLDQGNRMLAKRLKLDVAAVAPTGVRLIGLDENRRLLGATGQPPALAENVKRISDFFLSRGQLTRPVTASMLLRNDLLP
jgi:NitT/TauT family transport system substrate-binding protein